MGFFLIKKRDEKIEQLNTTLQNSFGGVKRDIVKVFEWLNYFHQKSLYQEHTIRELQKQMNFIPKSKEELRELIDEHYGITPLHHKVDRLKAKMEQFEDTQRALSSMMYKVEDIRSKVANLEETGAYAEHLTRKIDSIKSKIESLEESHKPIKSYVEEHSTRLEKLENRGYSVSRPTTNARENLIKKIAKSSKDHVKTILRSLIIKYGQISALQLREIIVEEQALCSKSSFYRILEELETEDEISVIHEKKEKKFVFNVARVSQK